MNRLLNLHSLTDHTWYKNYFAKLSQTDILSMRAFCKKHAGLSVPDFARKVDLMYDGVVDKPKRWKDITELLHVINKEGVLSP